jgi:hypothetical protein
MQLLYCIHTLNLTLDSIAICILEGTDPGYLTKDSVERSKEQSHLLSVVVKDEGDKARWGQEELEDGRDIHRWRRRYYTLFDVVSITSLHILCRHILFQLSHTNDVT